MRNKQITVGALLSYGAIFFNIVSGLLYTPWMIRTIGDDQYALYTLAISVVNLFLMDFGIGSAVTKFLSSYYAKERFDEVDRFISVIYRIFIFISAVIAICLLTVYLLIDRVYVKLTSEEVYIFKRLFVIVATYSVLTFPFTTFNGILMADEQFIGLKACNFAYRVLSVILIVVCLMAGHGVYALVLIHALGNVFFYWVKYLIIRKRSRVKVNVSEWDPSIARDVIGYSAGITVISIAQRCIFNIMPSIIAALVGSVDITLFSLAATLESYFYSFADAVNGMFMPRISRILTHDDSNEQLQGLMSSVGRFHVATLGLLYLGFALVGQEFVELWMGPGYKLVYWCAMLLIFPSMIDVPQQVARTALLASGVVWRQSWIYVGMAIVNLVVAFVLIPRMGILGAGLSVCVAYLIRTAGFNMLYRKALSIGLKRYFISTYARWSIVALVTIVAGLWLLPALPICGWGGLLCKAILISVIYAATYLMLCLSRTEKQALLRKFKK